ncbi:MAG: cytochrome P450 [Deltaproteobacteria bacterium]|nr:cytochrome P450 [Deltaproteobacteria bacterium]
MDVDVHYLASETWIEADMRERFGWLRNNDPVYWSEKDQIWIITKFEDVAYCSKHQDLFTSAEGVLEGLPVKLGLIDEAEPRHAQLRGLINNGFTPRMVTKLEKRFREITREVIDEVASKGECDFVEAISVPLPLRLIAHMMGIRPEDYDDFHRWSDHMIGAEGRLDDVEAVTKAATAYTEYATYISEVIADRRKNPRDDLVSILTGAKDEGVLVEFEQTREELSDAAHARGEDDAALGLHNDELIKLMVLLLVAGNETTRNGISGGVALLIENPAERQKLIDDPSLLNSAVEEMLRVVTPIHSFTRTVTQDTQLRGKKLEEGQHIVLAYSSANRDEDEFEDPDRFCIDRNPTHVAFGLGSHFCLGANLARMEMRVSIEQVLRRMQDLEYSAGGPVLVPSRLVRTCAEMKVRFTPEA